MCLRGCSVPSLLRKRFARCLHLGVRRWAAGGLILGLSACGSVGPSVQAMAQDCANDAQLLANGPALVYVWSPRMVLSALEAHQAHAAAVEMGLAFRPVVDGRLPIPEWHAAMQQMLRLAPASAQALQGTRPMCAPSLEQQLAYRHFPTGFLVVQGQAHMAPLVGAMPQAFWAEGLRLRLQDTVALGASPPKALYAP